MSTSEIYNSVRINERLTTAGQPTEAQLRAAAAEGFTTVINLVPPGSVNELPDEAGLIEELGLAYIHIPVDWNRPTDADFAAFVAALDRLAGGKLLIHCAANYRVTAFYGLYAQKRLGWTEAEAEELRARVWEGDYPVWEAFIRRVRADLADGESVARR